MYEMIFTSFVFHIYSLRHITFIVVLLSKKVADVIAVLSINNSFIGVHMFVPKKFITFLYILNLYLQLITTTHMA